MTSPLTPEHQAFHAHLDACRHCRHNPFDLCPKGASLLMAAARSIEKNFSADPVLEHFTNRPRPEVDS
jgi:hypothetical protein